jgi:hypothetical protein
MPLYLSTPFLIHWSKRHLEEITAGNPGFPRQLRKAALKAIETDEPFLLRRALIALAFVGLKSDAAQVEYLTRHPNADVAKDARTCLFELNRRAREIDPGTTFESGGH